MHDFLIIWCYSNGYPIWQNVIINIINYVFLCFSQAARNKFGIKIKYNVHNDHAWLGGVNNAFLTAYLRHFRQRHKIPFSVAYPASLPPSPSWVACTLPGECSFLDLKLEYCVRSLTSISCYGLGTCYGCLRSKISP